MIHAVISQEKVILDINFDTKLKCFFTTDLTATCWQNGACSKCTTADQKNEVPGCDLQVRQQNNMSQQEPSPIIFLTITPNHMK